MATEEGGKGEAQRQPLPHPATTTEMYLAAILDELKVIRQRTDPIAQIISITAHDDSDGELLDAALKQLAPTRQQAKTELNLNTEFLHGNKSKARK
jgi:hypothetical protein